MTTKRLIASKNRGAASAYLQIYGEKRTVNTVLYTVKASVFGHMPGRAKVYGRAHGQSGLPHIQGDHVPDAEGGKGAGMHPGDGDPRPPARVLGRQDHQSH